MTRFESVKYKTLERTLLQETEKSYSARCNDRSDCSVSTPKLFPFHSDRDGQFVTVSRHTNKDLLNNSCIKLYPVNFTLVQEEEQ